jgi:hypothetical protein
VAAAVFLSPVHALSSICQASQPFPPEKRRVSFDIRQSTETVFHSCEAGDVVELVQYLRLATDGNLRPIRGFYTVALFLTAQSYLSKTKIVLSE